MKAVIQRVKQASVGFENQKRHTQKGLVVFLGVGTGDSEKDAQWLADKILGLRIFPNPEGKFDRSVSDIKGEILVVSQFTLFGDCTKGKRPDFLGAARPEKAIPLYETFINYIKNSNLTVKTGEFAKEMLVEIHNDGPVTIIIDTEKNIK
ncbi:MAG: D-tyrosyl-tRNA(Tyr) deacylase [Endomicrobiales bacterium]|nr:D-tyrosyl-tRNA(Tyr) deacylase [Endomicrobiales bacterium]